jgi:hypothetical protein
MDLFTEPNKTNEVISGIYVIVSASPSTCGASQQASQLTEAKAEGAFVFSACLLIDAMACLNACKMQEKISCLSNCKKGGESMKDYISVKKDSGCTNKTLAFLCGFCFRQVANTTRDHFDHSCNLCGTAFKCHTLLKRHTKKETTYCENCGEELRGCETKRVPENMKQQCSFCGESFECVHLKNHTRNSSACKQFRGSVISNDAVSATIITCMFCSEQLSTFEDKFEHLRKRTSPCSRHFKCHAQYTTHVRLHIMHLALTLFFLLIMI